MPAYLENVISGLEDDAFEYGFDDSRPTLTFRGVTRSTFAPRIEGFAGLALQILDAAIPASKREPHINWSYPLAGPFNAYALKMLPHLAFDALPKFFSKDDRRTKGFTLTGKTLSSWIKEKGEDTGHFDTQPLSYLEMHGFSVPNQSAPTWGGAAPQYPSFPSDIAFAYNREQSQIQHAVTAALGTNSVATIYARLDEQTHKDIVETYALSILNRAFPPCTDGLNARRVPVGLVSETAFQLSGKFSNDFLKKLPAMAAQHRNDPAWRTIGGLVVPTSTVVEWAHPHVLKLLPIAEISASWWNPGAAATQPRERDVAPQLAFG